MCEPGKAFLSTFSNFKRMLEMEFPVCIFLPMQKCAKTCACSMGSALLLNSNQQHPETFAAGSGFLTFWCHENPPGVKIHMELLFKV